MREAEVPIRILVDRRPTNAQVGAKGTPGYFADVVMCVDGDSGYIFGAEMVHPEEGDSAIVRRAEEVLRVLRERPRQQAALWVVRQGRIAEVLAGKIRAEDIRFEHGDFVLWDEAYLSMDRHMGGGGMLPYLWRGDISEQEMAELFAAAADFYKLRPWQLVTDADLHEKPGGSPGEPPLLFSVMGASGISRGLALFDTKAAFDAMMEDQPPHGVVYASLEPVTQMPHTMTEEARQHGWRIANKSAFPMVVRTRHGKPIPCSGADLRRMITALRLIGEIAGAFREMLKNQPRRHRLRR